MINRSEMRFLRIILLLIFLSGSIVTFSQTRTIHVFVALCDNANQGIVPVPQTLGNGQDPKRNLYWGAMYGVRSFFKHKTNDWIYQRDLDSENPMILARTVFKHVSEDVYLLAEAYDGLQIEACIKDFLKSSNRQNPIILQYEDKNIAFGGGSNLVAYVGHDGLMEFDVDVIYKETSSAMDAMILACASKRYFSNELAQAGANPVLWTTHLMAPEAYTLKAALDGWMLLENNKQIEERAAQAYHAYQKCGLRGARNLFTSGY